MPTRVVLCTSTDQPTRLEVCQVVLDSGAPPDWVPLIPPGVKIKALDGRKFRNPNPQGVVDRFLADPRDLAIDWEHAGEIKAPHGEPAPAAGWIVELEIREGGAIWGRVEWTPKGAESLQSREYRYISPAFKVADDGSVFELVSAGLVNRPALDMPSLAHDVPSSGATHCDQNTYQEIDHMDPKLLALLGLSADATADQVYRVAKQLHVDLETARLSADKVAKDRDEYKELLATAEKEIATAREANGVPPIEKFVPRADHDAVVARAESAEAKLKEQFAEAHKVKVDVAIDAALKAGKIVPSSVDYHRALCEQEGGLERFAAYVEQAPVIVGDPDKTLDKKPAENAKKELTAEQRQIAVRCGLSGDALKFYEETCAAQR